MLRGSFGNEYYLSSIALFVGAISFIMAYRFTNTEKWGDAWFASLKPMEKLLFNYICDNCDIAGFIEYNPKKWAVDIGIDRTQIELCLKGINRAIIYSSEEDCIYIRNFIKHQKNYPLNENNKAHRGIFARYEYYSYKFDIEDITEFIQRGFKGASKPLPRGTGIGIGNGKGKITKIDVYSFDEFWNDYSKKVGDKDKLIKKWEKLSDEVKLKIKDYIPNYKKSQPDIKFRKNPETFLNNKSWEDELIYSEQIPNNNGNRHNQVLCVPGRGQGSSTL